MRKKRIVKKIKRWWIERGRKTEKEERERHIERREGRRRERAKESDEREGCK